MQTIKSNSPKITLKQNTKQNLLNYKDKMRFPKIILIYEISERQKIKFF